MLDLLRFKKEFVSLCRDELCESGPGDMVIEERKVNKAQRGVLNGMLFRKEGLNCAPTLYVEDFYKAYKAGSSIPDLSHQAVETVVRSLGMANMLSAESFERLADPVNYRVRLLYKNRNKEYLKDKPALEVGCGLAFIAEIDGGEYGAVFTDALLKETGMSKDELFDKAGGKLALRVNIGRLADCDCGRILLVFGGAGVKNIHLESGKLGRIISFYIGRKVIVFAAH